MGGAGSNEAQVYRIKSLLQVTWCLTLTVDEITRQTSFLIEQKLFS